MIRRLAAVGLALHGLIHVIGFVVPWRIATLEGFAYRTTAFDGGLDLGAGGVQVIGLVWLALTLAFLVAGYGVWRGASWAVGLTGALAIASLVVCILGLPETVAGVAINLVVLAALGYVGFLKPDRSAST